MKLPLPGQDLGKGTGAATAMLSKVKCALSRHRGFVSNTAGLYVETLTSYLFPLITLPYLVRVLGPQGFGTLAFAQSLVAYLGSAVEYGAVLSATRTAAAEQKEKVLGRLYWNVAFARLWLFLAAEALVLTFTVAVPRIREAAAAVWPLSAILLAQALSPNWLYLGRERMAELARLNVMINFGAVAAILLFVRKPDDLMLLAAILGAGPLAGSIIAVVWATRRWPLPWVPPSFREARNFLVSGFPLFLTVSATNVFTEANSFVLGLLADKQTVAFFSGAEKLVRSVQRFLTPIITSLYPTMVRTAEASREKLLERGKKLAALFFGLGLLASLALALTSRLLINLFLGQEFAASVPVFRLLCLSLPLSLTANAVGVHLLLPLRKDRPLIGIQTSAGLLTVLLAATLAPTFGAPGMAAALVAVTTWVLLAHLLVVRQGQRPIGGSAQRSPGKT